MLDTAAAHARIQCQNGEYFYRGLLLLLNVTVRLVPWRANVMGR